MIPRMGSAARSARKLGADNRGVTAIEFAILAPTLCVLLMGAYDLGHALYVEAALEGIMQKSGRDTALEGADEPRRQAIDAVVRAQAHALVGQDANIEILRKSFRTFDAAAKRVPEQWTDTNDNGTCDNGEPYVDANSNSHWDPDGANNAQGGAKDKTLYSVSVTYRRLFPIYKFINLPPDVTVVARTALQNQPYADQAAAGTKVLNCS